MEIHDVVDITHSYRKADHFAGELAKAGKNLQRGMEIIDVGPYCILKSLEVDSRGNHR